MKSNGRVADSALGRKQLVLLIAVVASLAGLVVGLSANKAIWEGWVTDRLFQVRASFIDRGLTSSSPVAVVGLDQASLDSERLSRIPRVLMTPVMAEAGQAVLDAGATALGFDFVFAYSADSFVDPSTGEARLSGFDRPFQSFAYRNRGKVFIAHTEIGVPHRSFTAAIGAGGVRSVIVSTDNDGIVRKHVPQLPLNDSPHLIDALLGGCRVGRVGCLRLDTQFETSNIFALYVADRCPDAQSKRGRARQAEGVFIRPDRSVRRLVAL